MNTHFFSRYTTWTVFASLLVALGLGACSDVSNAPAPPAPPAAPAPLAILTAAPLPDGTINQAYNLTLTPSGGAPPYTWSLATGSPQLPTGLSLSTSDGHITGTPTDAMTRNTEFKLEDSKGASVQKVLPITINLAPVPLTILTSSLPNGSINLAYAIALGPNGGTTPYTWGLKAGSPPLPSGLSLDPSSGVITGTPTVTSNVTHTFTLGDATGLTVEKSLQLVINAIPLSITTSSLPQGTANQNYSATLVAAGGTGTYTWGLAGGSPALPTGLTLNTASGLISGIPTGTSNQNYTFTVTDQTPPTPQTATKTLQLIIGAAPPTLVIDTNSLPLGTVLQSYSFTLASSGGSGAKNWDILSGSLPAGLNLNSSGVISGTPVTTGTSSPTFRVRDSGNPQQSAQKQLSIIIGLPAAPNITTTSLSSGTFNVAYNQTPLVTGGIGTLIWGVTSGGLPPGLSLNSSNGNISGTPTSTGQFPFTLRVTDSIPQSDEQNLTITINPPAPPSINSFTLTTGTVNQPYPNTQLTATGGALPYTWSVNPALPNGLSLNPSSGVISGTPLSGSNGVTFHTFTVSDSTLPTHQTSSTAPKSITINANVTPVAITTSTLPAGTVGQSYTGQLAASGGTPLYTFSENTGSSLPTGLTINGSGAISGIPTGAGTTSTTFRVQDSTTPNQQSATRSISITINAAPPPLNITTTTLPDGTFDQVYNQPLVASGGTPSYTWSLASGTPPAGLTLGTDGVISGTPTGVGTSNFTVQVTDDSLSQTDTQALSLTIVPPGPPTITTTTLPNGTVGAAYLQSLQHTGGTAPLTWDLAVGTVLPDGLSLSAEGSISGTPTTAGPSNFTVEIIDTFSQSDTQVLSITID